MKNMTEEDLSRVIEWSSRMTPDRGNPFAAIIFRVDAEKTAEIMKSGNRYMSVEDADDDKMKGLAEYLKSSPQKVFAPTLVGYPENGKIMFTISDGRHRWAAQVAAGLKAVVVAGTRRTASCAKAAGVYVD
jgi:hypothetical protein